MNTHCLALWQTNGRRGVPMLIVLLVTVLMIVQPAIVLAEDESSPAEEAGLGIGSGLLSLVYFPLKLVYATLGGIVGGFTYVLTGGDLETAQTVWEPSFYGTYLITPAHLKGDEAVRFYGVSPYEDEQ